MTTQDAHKKVRAGTRLAVTLALVAVLSGCALQPAGLSQSAGSVVAGSDQGKPVDANLSGFLDQAPPGAVTDLAESPWGANVMVSVEAPYYAASGRVCRQMRIESARGPVTPQVACETAGGDWVVRRQVTQALAAQGGSR
ncbi:DVU3141 family protein [Halomonas sp.]|uniref:DVU3141 family protein n=1 Tax=Halomonas sp. TaxID=1486246 RepID=UPI00298D9A06|nr:DVU3141 family protein [Halomonas sp.]MDW7748824.1 DVU3141 family protein [Halomonas sp.]